MVAPQNCMPIPAIRGDANWHSYNKVDVEKLESTKTYLTDHMTEVAIEMLHSVEEPFLMYKAFHAPHFPFHAPSKVRTQFLNDLAPKSALPAELLALGETRDTIEQKLDTVFHLAPFMASREHILGDAFNGHDKVATWNMDNENIRSYIIRVARAMYLSNVKAMDNSLGDILQFLTDAGKLENTYIVYASDNGAAVENFQSANKNRGYKGNPFEGGVKTFAMISGPEIPADTEYTGIFHLTDWLPTLATAAKINNGQFRTIDGIDQFNAITKSASKGPRQDVHLHYQLGPDRKAPGRTKNSPMMAMRSGPYKLLGGLPKTSFF